MKQGWRFLLLAGLSAVAFLLFLGGPDIVTSHEARVAQPARVMAASGWPWSAAWAEVPPVVLQPGVVRLMPNWTGTPVLVNPWLVPVLNGQVRLQKPPLPYWCSAVLFRLFGFSEFANRFFPALMGAISTFLLFDLGKRLFGIRTAWYTALVWVSTYAVPEMYRKAMADPYLAFFTLMCVWAWTAASRPNAECSLRRAQARGVKREEWEGRQKEGESKKLESRTEKTKTASTGERTLHSSLFPLHSSLPLLFYFSLALALLAKGPPAFVNILVPLVALHACSRRAVPGRLWVHLSGIVMVLAITLPWPIYVMRHVPHAIDVWRYESVGELTDNTENARPWWFYIPQLFYLSLPWTPLWIVGCVIPFIKYAKHRARNRARTGDRIRLRVVTPRRQLAFFPLAWWSVAVLFFSFVHLKKATYLLPAMPAVALMTGLALATILPWARLLRFKAQPGTFIAIQAIIGVGLALAIGGLIFHELRQGALAAGVGVFALACALVPLPFMFSRRPSGWLTAQAAAYTIMILLFTHFYLAPTDNGRSARQAAQVMTKLCEDPAYTILMPRIAEEVAVYLPANAKYGFGHKVLVAIDDSRGVRERGVRQLPMTDPDVNSFAGWVFDGVIVSVRRIPIPGGPADSRWKVYELTVSRQAFAIAVR